MKKKHWILLDLAAVIVLVGLLAGAVPVLMTQTSALAASGADGTKDSAKAVSAAKAPPWKAPDQEAAKQRALEVVPFVDTVIDECLLCRQQKLRDKGFGTEDITHKYFWLDSPIIKKNEDRYTPVRFMHSRHAALVQDCAVCHHYRPTDPQALETTRCSACHQESFRSDHPDRIGLKAAYHMNCIDCHKKMNNGPVDCTGCHLKKVPEHKELVAKLSAKPEPSEVTTACLSCHKNAGEDMLSSVHWLWKGPSSYTMDHRKEVMHGKATTTLNNF